MGCGCSHVVRQVNPSENSSSAQHHSWLKPNGKVPSVDTVSGDVRTPAMVHCGVDTSSLHGSGSIVSTSRGAPSPFTANVGVQCELIANHRSSFGLPDTGHPAVIDERYYRALRARSSLGFTARTLSRSSEELHLLRTISSERISKSGDHDDLFRTVTNAGQGGQDVNGNLGIILRPQLDLGSPTSEMVNSNYSFIDFLSKTCGLSSAVSSRSIDGAMALTVDVFNSNRPLSEVASRSDASIQTERQTADPKEVPEFAPRPPPCRKVQLITTSRFDLVDQHVLQTPDDASRSVRRLVRYLTSAATCDVEKVRTFYFWICHNIRYDIRYADLRMTPENILDSGAGVCRHYCQLFSEMCQLSGIRVRELSGFAKGFDYRIGHRFRPKLDGPSHSWNAVFLNGSWRFVDCTWGTGFMNSLGQFQERFQEHFFLTDPDVFSWTHFPYSESEENYSRWQLLDAPLTLAEFNSRPRVYPQFFEYNVKIRSVASTVQSPIIFTHSTEILLWTPQVLRYKYKFYPLEGVESHQLDRYVFCQLKEKRLVGSFTVTPPDDGHYFLKIYARPEGGDRQLRSDSVVILDCIVMFALECTKSWKNVPRLPLNDQPWGVTDYLAEFGLKFLNVGTPVLVVITGRKVILLETTRAMLISQQLTDADGTVLGQKNVIHRTLSESNQKVVKFIVQPPNVGLYKLTIYACPNPNERGRWPLPRVATFLVDCKQTLWMSGELREQMYNRKSKKKY